MTTSKLTEAVRMLRDTSVTRGNSAHVVYLALASALEELAGKGGVGGEDDETQMCPRFGTADHAVNDCVLCLGTGRVPKEPADTVHFRFVLDGVEHDDIRYVLDKMPPEQRTAALAPYRDPVVEGLHIRSKEAEQRAEAAEARASSWKTTAQSIGCMVVHVFGDGTETGALLDQHELDGKCNALLIKAGSELEAARARVGELEAFFESCTDLEKPNALCLLHQIHARTNLCKWFESHGHEAAAKAYKEATAFLDEPTPSAPTPPGYCECGTTEHATESTGRVRFCGKCGRGYVAATPASTIAAVSDSLPTDADDERIVDGLVARRAGEARVMGGPAPAVVESKQARAPGCKCHWEEGDSPCPVHGENEESPPGLTPEEAEGGAR